MYPYILPSKFDRVYRFFSSAVRSGTCFLLFPTIPLLYTVDGARKYTEDEKSLGKSLIEQFSADMGFDLGETKKDENFSISFSIRHKSKSGKNEIYNAQLRSLANVKHPESKNKEDDQFMPDTRDLDVAIKQILMDNGIELKSDDSIGFDFSKEGVFTFDSEASHIDGLDDCIVEFLTGLTRLTRWEKR